MTCLECGETTSVVYACIALKRCYTGHVCARCIEAHARKCHPSERAVYAVPCCRDETVRVEHISREVAARLQPKKIRREAGGYPCRPVISL